jgi:predicted DNA-binding transcriptional regulator AlpA
MKNELLLPEVEALHVPWQLKPMGVGDIAEFLKRSPGYVRTLVRNEDFPEPITQGSRSRRWLAGEVVEFIQSSRTKHLHEQEMRPINIHYLPITSELRPKRRNVS